MHYTDNAKRRVSDGGVRHSWIVQVLISGTGAGALGLERVLCSLTTCISCLYLASHRPRRITTQLMVSLQESHARLVFFHFG